MTARRHTEHKAQQPLEAYLTHKTTRQQHTEQKRPHDSLATHSEPNAQQSLEAYLTHKQQDNNMQNKETTSQPGDTL